MRKLVFLALLLISMDSFAQKMEMISEKDKVIERAISELDAAMQPPEGKLFAFATEYGINGEFTFDITIREKGLVATVFVVGSENADLKKQNMLKDKVKSFKFSFKMPKGKSYKFQYVFKFNQ